MGPDFIHSHGASFFACIALASSVLASSLPMWLITRKELHGHACWRGEGLWTGGGVEWGNLGDECGEWEPKSHCGLANDTASEDSSRDRLCSEMTAPQVMSVLSIVCWIIYWACTFVLGRTVGDTKARLVGQTVSSFLAFVWSLTVFTLVNTGELFSQSHYSALSDGLIRPYDGIGCVFQTPLGARSIKELVSDSPLQCLFAGPGFVAGATAFSLGFMCFGFHLLDLVKAEPKRLGSESCHARSLGICKPLFGSTGASVQDEMEEENQDQLRVPMLSEQQGSEIHSDPSVTASSGSEDPDSDATSVPRSSLYFVLRAEYGTCKAFMVPLVVLASLISLATFMCFQATTVSAIVTLGTEPTGAESKSEVKDVFKLREDVFDFTLIESIIYFFRGDAYMLAALTLVFGLVWPYLKVFLWFVGYFLEMDGEKRYWVFGWLDTMGKWSFCNGFVLSLMMVAFFFENKQTLSRWLAPLLVPSHHEIVADIEVTVDPGIGTYMYIFNVLVSIVVGHILVLVDRHANALLVKTRRIGRLAPTQSAIVQASAFDSRDLDEQSGDSQVQDASQNYSLLLENSSKWYQRGMALGIISAAILAVAGIVTPCYSFNFGGIIGGSVVPQEQRSRDFSVLSTGLMIGTSGTGPSEAGIIYLSILYFSLCIILPLVRLVALWWVAHVPMKLGQHIRWLHIIEVLETYAALDVLLVSIVSTGFEITELSNAVLSSAFPGMEKIVDSALPEAGGLFAVKQSFLAGIWLLAAAVIMEKLVSYQLRSRLIDHLKQLHLQAAAI